MTEHFQVMVAALTLATLGGLHLVFCGLAELAWYNWRQRILAMPAGMAQPILLAIAAGPLLLASGIVGLLVLPALLHYEPNESAERPGVLLLSLGAVAVLVAARRGIRLTLAAYGNWRMARLYRKSAKLHSVVEGVPVKVLDTNDPQVMLLGSLRPTVYVSQGVVSRLSEAQLQAVIDHELAHHRRHDVAAMWLLRVAGETTRAARDARKAWALRAELMADAHAADATGDSLLIAEALTTVASLGRPTMAQPAVAAFLTSDAFSDLRFRVERLMTYRRENRTARPIWVRLAMLAGVLAFIASYPTLIAWTDRAVEFLAM